MCLDEDEQAARLREALQLVLAAVLELEAGAAATRAVRDHP